MDNIVTQLYGGQWDSSVQKALEIVPLGDARHLVQQLTLSTGWRERVAAAKIVSAYKLHDLLPALIQTFTANPETYTARAFARLLSSPQSAGSEALLSQLRASCPPGSYGDHLREVIDSARTTSPGA